MESGKSDDFPVPYLHVLTWRYNENPSGWASPFTPSCTEASMKPTQIPSLACALFLALAAGGCADEPTAPIISPDAVSLSRVGADFSFTTIEVPGATRTGASGIHAGGDIVGSYGDANGVHGFLLRDGVFTTIDYPGAVMTEARGIGAKGDIVGTYKLPQDVGTPVIRGFKRTPEGAFEQVAYPGHASTMPQRILPDGTILGCRHDHDFTTTMRGVVISSSGNSETDAFASMHNGATPDLRRIAGLYTNQGAGRTEGYVIDDGVFEPFVVPGSIMTAAWDVNPAGQVAGVYRTSDLRFHGFVRTGDEYASIDVPGAAATRAFGINARGDVVGQFIAGGKAYGFLATRGSASSR